MLHFVHCVVVYWYFLTEATLNATRVHSCSHYPPFRTLFLCRNRIRSPSPNG
jgi:hypothetical protein